MPFHKLRRYGGTRGTTCQLTRRSRRNEQGGNGGASRDRTDDLIVANDALSQLSYSPTKTRGNLLLRFYQRILLSASEASLARPRDFYRRSVKKLDELTEAIDLHALFIAVNASKIFGAHHSSYIVSFDASRAKLRGIGGANLHDGYGGHAGKYFLLRMLKSVKAITLEGRWRRGRALLRVLSVHNADCRIVDEMHQLSLERVHIFIRQSADVEPRLGIGRDHVGAEAALDNGRHERSPQHGVVRGLVP